MIYVYAILTALLLGMTLAGHGYKKDFFEGIPKKEHRLRFFYGISLRLYEMGKSLFPRLFSSGTEHMLKSLTVRENVRKDTVLYGVKKIALCMALLVAASAMGLLYCIAGKGESAVTVLKRNEYGQGDASYELEISYDGETQTIGLEIEERLYTDEEIYALFEDAYEAVGEELLGDNESAENVTEALNLVSGYGQIDITWETDDSQSLDYNGEITAALKEGESLTLNLLAYFSLEDVTSVYTYTVIIKGETVSEAELLYEAVIEAIEAENSIYESEVELPEEINGKKISFSETGSGNEAMFIILGIIALAAVTAFYDRKLEKKMEERRSQMLMDFSEIVSKLSLLYEAGMSIFKAWEKIISDYESRKHKKEHYAYREMKLALEKIKSGMGEQAAYEEFGIRCGLHPYIKLGNILSQNLSKGSRGMKLLLAQEAENAFEDRKRLARKKGEEAGTKMLIPMILLLVVVIVIVAVPALMSVSL